MGANEFMSTSISLKADHDSAVRAFYVRFLNLRRPHHQQRPACQHSNADPRETDMAGRALSVSFRISDATTDDGRNQANAVDNCRHSSRIPTLLRDFRAAKRRTRQTRRPSLVLLLIPLRFVGVLIHAYLYPIRAQSAEPEKMKSLRLLFLVRHNSDEKWTKLLPSQN